MLSYFLHTKKQKFREQYKTKYVTTILSEIFDDLVYLPKAGISRNELSAAMIWTGINFEAEDYISASYNVISFEQSDVGINCNYRHNKNYSNVFTGRWIKFKFNKNFKEDFVIAEKGVKILTVDKWYLGYAPEYNKFKSRGARLE